MRKVIDVATWNRKSVYNYFGTFSNPCYGFNVEMDITSLVELTKKRGDSFFINMLFLVYLGLESIEEMRTRIVNDEVVVYDEINPAYTVMTNLGAFENCGVKATHDYAVFYKRVHEDVEMAKAESRIKDSYNDSKLMDEYYITCIPWLSFESMTHPLPDNDHSNASVPRVCWGKYYEKDGRIKIMLNITVSHMLVDGKALSDAFKAIQNNFDNAEKLLH